MITIKNKTIRLELLQFKIKCRKVFLNAIDVKQSGCKRQKQCENVQVRRIQGELVGSSELKTCQAQTDGLSFSATERKEKI